MYNLSKCQQSSAQMSPLRNNPQPLQKEERLAHPTRRPPAFWDNLSENLLARSALRELERRNTDDFLHKCVSKRKRLDKAKKRQGNQ
ncbi:hypothetical protein GGR58DRAFT_492988 [Xylaria digitata]|nr:hypothetical protein GGR58DRAFT_492988 [Xylaria digitata]